MTKQCFIAFTLLLSTLFATAQTPHAVGLINQYKTDILTLTREDGTLEGTLVTPTVGKKFPLVLIIAGSGPTDRDCNAPVGLKTNTFKMIAEGLAAKGIASFRYDKRHIGKSKMTQKITEVSFDDYVDDATHWLDTLKTMKRARHFSKFIVAGHSEGSLIGMLTVQKTKADGFISLSGPAESIDSIIYEQLGKQAPFLVPQLKDVYAKWKRGEKVDTIPPMLKSIANPYIQKFMTNAMQYTPKEEIKKLKIPILIVSGKHDVQVLPKEAEALAKANPKAKVVFFDKMTHVLKDGDANLLAAQSLYIKIDAPLTEGLVDALVGFVR